MAAIKRWAIIDNNVVSNVILADEDFISEQGLIAIQDDLATPGLQVDEDGNIIYPTINPYIEPLPDYSEEVI